ncbi:gliding motility-associated-like protein [Flavobacterium croceum DSM 17960]|uniref:Gliding motility-associated-like protein n=1 Tax=Flavobacterium croceum DSM 17960 TaxID=1121886 RepID=A0A2S4N821_9FLAO|nr:CUB domain-containing protein [Flavobacterium croceum]POS01828.1 gliding motility-associated-like protein [Flavobacterium croceum DSM 17960]
MKKITFLVIFLFSIASSFAQLALEGFENTTGPDALPATNWTLGTGNWAVFDNGVGLAKRWTVNATPYAGTQAAFIDRENIGQNNTSEDFLATPLVTVPTNGQLRFWTRLGYNGDAGAKLQIRVAPATAPSQTNTASYTTIQEWTETSLVTTYNVYEEKTVDLVAAGYTPGSQIYIAFVMQFTQTGTTLSGDRWFIDDARVISQCLPPTNLTTSALTHNSASLTWTPNGATSWEIEVVQGTTAPTGTGTVYNGALPYVVNGLTPNTAYSYYVRSLCTDSNSAWAGPFSFTTTLAPLGCGGNFTDPGGPNANYANSANVTTVICPQNPGDVVTVTFTSFALENNWDFLKVYNGNSNTAPQIGNYTGTTLPPSITSTAANGCLTFVFTSDSSVNAAGWVANVTCAPPPTCPKPTAITATAVTSNQATISWTNNSTATQFQVIALPCSAAAPDASTTGWQTASASPFVYTGLTPDTCYKFYVRAVCSSTDLSLWSQAATATTQPSPPVCGGTFTDPGGATANYANSSNITYTICPTNPGEVVTVSFSAFALENNWDFLKVYNGNSNTAPQIGNYTGTTLPPDITSTAANGCLTFVFTSDSSVNAAGWVASVTCAAPPTCPKPTAITATAVTSNQATIGWTNNSTATQFQVIALPCSAAAPDASTTGWQTASANPFVYTGLTPDTCYKFYVRAVCSSTDLSLWSQAATATTQPAPPVCGGTFTDPGGANANYANSSNITYTICPTNPGDVVTVTFTSFALENNFDFLKVYDGNSAAATQIGNYTGTTLPPQIDATNPTGCLTFVFTSDSVVNAAGWVASVTCAPPPTCPKPTNLVATPLNSTSATLTWTENGTATQWEVIVQPSGTGMPSASATGVIVNGTPTYTPNNLTPGTSYEYWVRAICSSTDHSTWNGPKSFYITQTCADSMPFCGETGLNYTNITGAPSYGSIGCLFTTPNPAWYFMQVDQTGPLSLQISQTSNSTGNGIDVDFICWGPFSSNDFSVVCNSLNDYPDGNIITPSNIVACSYSAAPIENFTITNAQAGEYYVILITNYSNQAGTVNFTQTNNGQTGAGTTDCAIVCSVELGPDVSLCNQTSYTITSSNQNADSYAWYNGTTLLTGQTSSTLVVTQSGTYKCVITCGLNTSEDTKTVTFNTSPVVTVASQTICDGQTATLTANVTPSTGTYTYAWTVPTGVTNPGSVASFTTTIAGTYSVVVTNTATTCQSTPATATVTINALPNVTVGNSVICADGLATVEAVVNGSSTYTYAWSVPTGFTDPGNVSSFTTNVAGTYSVIVTDTFTGCVTGSISGIVTVNPLPVVSVNNQVICADGTATITATPSNTTATYTYAWSVPAGVTNPGNVSTFTTNVAGNYTVQITDVQTSCVSQPVTAVVTVNPLPVVTVNSPTICQGQSATVTATPSDTTQTYSYIWTVPTGATDPGNVASFSTSFAGTYSVVATNTTTNCVGTSASGTVTVNPTPTVSVSSSTICAGASTTVTATPSDTTQTYTYVWTVPTGVTNPGSVASFTTTVGGNYSVTITNTSTGCTSALATGTVTVNALPTVQVVIPEVCLGTSSTVTANVSPAAGTYTYVWTVPAGVTNPGNVSSFTTNVAGTYSVIVTNSSTGCTSTSASASPVYNDLPDYTIFGSCEGSTYVLKLIDTNFTSSSATYLWYSTTNPNLGTTSTLTVTAVGEYFCKVTNVDGCVTIKSINVASINCQIQKGISPNNDGKNDKFDLTGLDVQELQIYNRYGRIVYSKTNYIDEWTGLDKNNNELPDGTYYYVINLKSGDNKTGWVYINREIK